MAAAWPDDRIVFSGEAEHVALVRAEFLERTPEARPGGQIEWRVADVPPLQPSGWPRFRADWRCHQQALQDLVSSRARFLLLCSASQTGLLATKLLMQKKHHAGRPVWILMHAMLSLIRGRWPRRLWNVPMHPRILLGTRDPAELRYLVLGPSIHAELARSLPQRISQFDWIHAPYVFAARHPEIPAEAPDPICFGYFGVSIARPKGFGSFLRMAAELHRAHPRSRFSHVGFVLDRRGLDLRHARVADLSFEPLTTAEYRRRALAATYAVAFTDPDHYRLTASASFLDALGHARPGLYLRNPYVEHYFQQIGDIGYLCNSYDEIRDLAAQLLERFPSERYRRQVENILDGRECFRPEAVARRLRMIMEPHLSREG
ncbi:MAG: hypothetical protein A2V88_13670 [Elusimicrobia bacterium RBG_16_66_12]|nr:MAG: hypothetical protein A2V88_13670 [Elusimicrobia bacterium RBG_16_66_12]